MYIQVLFDDLKELRRADEIFKELIMISSFMNATYILHECNTDFLYMCYNVHSSQVLHRMHMLLIKYRYLRYIYISYISQWMRYLGGDAPSSLSYAEAFSIVSVLSDSHAQDSQARKLDHFARSDVDVGIRT